MIAAETELFLKKMLGLAGRPGAHEPEAYAEYLRCFSNPDTIRATCDEYRAGATIDLVHDRADLAQKVKVPLLILWGQKSGQGSGYDLLKVWRDHAEDVRGHGIDSGHFIPEEQPDQVYEALKGFFGAV
jgi:haloacetate dehalogenase